MAAHARALGHCFNPISVFWCFDGDGAPGGVVVEVHNTYGDRHAYLVHPDEQGRARTDKQMYVSPFHGTDGTTRSPCRARRPADVAVTLHSDDGAVVQRLARRRPPSDRALSAQRPAAALRGTAAHPRPRHLAVGPPAPRPPPTRPHHDRKASDDDSTRPPAPEPPRWPGLDAAPVRASRRGLRRGRPPAVPRRRAPPRRHRRRAGTRPAAPCSGRADR